MAKCGHIAKKSSKIAKIKAFLAKKRKIPENRLFGKGVKFRFRQTLRAKLKA